jgi:hypothetical protein
MDMKKQAATFLEREGDNFFLPNKAALDSRATSEAGLFEIDWRAQVLAPWISETGRIALWRSAMRWRRGKS